MRSEIQLIDSNSDLIWNQTSFISDGVTTEIYRSIVSQTEIEQTYTFYPTQQQSQFSDLVFVIGASSLKWSINLINSAGSPSPQFFQFEFDLESICSGNCGPVTASVGYFENEPRSNMTTYILPVSSLAQDAEEAGRTATSTAIEVELFNVALVDNLSLVPINISIIPQTSTEDRTSFKLLITLPPFERSLSYDPSVSLGLLLQGNTQDGGGSSSNLALIIGVSLAIPGALLIVVLVAVVTTAGIYMKRKKRQRFLTRARDVMRTNS